MRPEIQALLHGSGVRTVPGYYRLDVQHERSVAVYTLIESRTQLHFAIRTADDIFFLNEDGDRRYATADELDAAWPA